MCVFFGREGGGGRVGTGTRSHTFFKCGPIVARLYMEISWYNRTNSTDIVKKYHRNRYNVKFTKFVETHTDNSGTTYRRNVKLVPKYV